MVGYIYQIINNENQKVYVGKTINFQNRKTSHIRDLENNTHCNKKLQKDWNKYGSNAFSFTYKKYNIENIEELNQLEIDTIKEKDSYLKGYNLTLGGDGGNTRGKLSFEDYCLIYIGCQWQGYTEKIGNYLNIDSSTVSTILRGKSYLWYKEEADQMLPEDQLYYKNKFREIFNIDNNKQEEIRVSYKLSEDEYFYCLCISKIYSRGIDSALAKYFGKHKSFLKNGIKSKTGKAKRAYDRFLNTSYNEILKIGEEKFYEWGIQKYSKTKLNVLTE